MMRPWALTAQGSARPASATGHNWRTKTGSVGQRLSAFHCIREDMPASHYGRTAFPRRLTSPSIPGAQIQRRGLIRICPAAADRSKQIRSVRSVDQQTAYQPSGNGMMSQTSRLSLAALGGRSKAPAWSGRLSLGAGATAVRTASSNRSNSASLIAHSQLRGCSVSKVLFSPIEVIAQIVSIRSPKRAWLMNLAVVGRRPPGTARPRPVRTHRRQYNLRNIQYNY